MTTANNTIILYPREYNLRGGDAKASVKGITHEGELVNIKLRISGNVKNPDAVSSISALAKTSMVESNHSCLSSPDNGPDNPMGVLLFMHCEAEKARDQDPEYSEYYISRWVQVLRSGHKLMTEGDYSNGLFIGTARIVIDKQSLIIKRARESIKKLTQSKSGEWEEAIQRNEAILNDFKSYDYFLYGYMDHAEQLFDLDDEAAMATWMDSSMGDPVFNHINGIFIRVEQKDGAIIQELVQEMFPIYLKDLCRYQNSMELIEYFKSKNPEIGGIDGARYRVMPMVKFPGKKVFRDSLLASQPAFQKMEETYYVGGLAQVFPIAAKVDRMDMGAIYLGKVHLLGPSMGNPVLLCTTVAPKAYASEEAPEITSPATKQGPLLISEQITQDKSIALADWNSPIACCAQLPAETAPVSAKNDEPIITEANPCAIEPEQEALQLAPASTLISPPEQPSVFYGINDDERQEEPEDSDSTTPAEMKIPGAQEDLLFDYEDMSEEAKSGSQEASENGDDEGPSLFGSKSLSFDHLTHDRPVPEISHKATDIQQKAEITHQVELMTKGPPEVVTDDHEPLGRQLTENLDVDTDFFADEAEITPVEAATEDDFDPWMDEDDLAKRLDEAPDAYSEETESDSLALIAEDKVVIPESTSALCEVLAQEVLSASPPMHRKGGLASFMKNRKSQV
jgi:hypothetical protein